MKHEKKTSFEDRLKTISVGISLLLTIGGVVIGLFNYFTLNQLQPFGYRLTAIEKAQAQAEEQRESLATRQQIDSLKSMVDGRLKVIEDKVEYIYRIHLK